MIGCIIQARMGSIRLPGKTLKLINGQTPMLKFQLDQLHFSDKIKKIVIATTILKEDDVIVNFCKKNNLEYYRGSSKDVLDRYYQCAKKFNFSTIVRITPDNPLIDPHIIDQVITLFINSKSDYVGNEHPKTYPLGFAVDVFSFTSLEKSWNEAKLPSEREHVTPYMYKNKNLFKNKNHFYEKNISNIRCTVDTIQDFKLIEKIIKKINKKPIYLENILTLFSNEPELLKINSHIKHDGYDRSLKDDIQFLNSEENN